ncbi:hypothetical protein I7I51_04171 [Histoplasma capsulatum]|uniref:Uncharacterized protein n=1 Tax=Ajellomyces capsulatus TaxID=5037 RepID=A0A8A1MBK8_AJECA|nr:hypothetical protein I7I51_04171 [Histoplasma capsulatum]
MRFENWDILLFPEGSKVPVQEFKTQCFVTRDNESPYMHVDTLANPTSHPLQPNYAQGIFGYTPILTTFVPSMSRSSPFRISIHSWKKPNPTRMMESLMQPDDAVMFEMRVLIDGRFIAGSLTNQRTCWPQVIDSSSHILEGSNLAWPNPGMWHQASRPVFKYNLGVDYGSIREQEDAHSHSPTRLEPRGIGFSDTGRSSQFTTWHHRLYPTPQTSWARPALPERDSRWPLQPVVQDPFVDTFREPGFSRRSRSTLDDVPMPDYAGSSSNGSRAISNMTGVSFGQHSKQPSVSVPINDEQYNQLIEALSPGKLTSGTYAPTNTPSSAHPIASKHSAAAEPRAPRSHSKHPNRPGALKELPQPGVRGVSGSSARSDSDEGFGSENAPLPTSLLSPNPKVKGKKEGAGSEVDTPLRGSNKVLTNSAKTIRRSKSSIMASAESKRKRLGTSDQVEIAEDNKSDSPSPTKKMSRLNAEDVSPRQTLEEALEPRTRVTATRRETENSE